MRRGQVSEKLRFSGLASSRGQVIMDFMITLSVMFIIFLVFAAMSSRRYTSAMSEVDAIAAREVVSTLALHINALHRASNGASQDVVLPLGINKPGDYRIDIYPSAHVIELTFNSTADYKRFAYPVLTSRFNGTLTNITRSVRLRNNQGVIQID